MANLLLVTRGTGGDLIPFLGIGSALKALGHHVTLLTHCYYANMVERASLNFAALDTPEEFEQFTEDGPLLNSPQGIPDFFRRHILPKVQSECKMIEKLCCYKDTVVVARHMSDLAVRIVAEKLEIPFVRVFNVAAQVATLPILEKLCRHILASDINQARADANLPPVRDWRGWVEYPGLSIATWPDWFASPNSGWPPGVIPVGFVNYDEVETGNIPHSIQRILNNSGTAPVLITGGLGTFMGSRFYAVGADACTILNRRGILVTRHRRLVPERLPDEVRWFDYLPFADLMPHVAAVIHHGGTCTSARAIAAGKPQLVLPYGSERPDTAARLQRLGIAEFLLPPQWQPELVAESLGRLLGSPQVQRRCKELAHRLHDTRAAATACDAIERFVADGGVPASSTWAGQTDGKESLIHESSSPEKRNEETQRLLEVARRTSPERRALLVLRLRKKKGAINRYTEIGEGNNDVS
jgi:rhamnosyltransferase subunit B